MMKLLLALFADAALPPDYFFESATPDHFALGLLYFFVIAPAIVALTVVLTVIYTKRCRDAEQKKP